MNNDNTKNSNLFKLFFAYFSFLLGYQVIQIFNYSFGSLHSLFLVLSFGVCGFLFLTYSGIKFRKMHYILLCLAFFFSSVFLLYSNMLIRFFALCYSMLLIIYVFFLTTNDIKLFSSNFVKNFIYASVIIPCSGMGDAPSAISSSIKRNGKGKNLLHTLLGLVITIPITAIIILLLKSADNEFGILLNNILGDLPETLFMFIIKTTIGIPVALYLFGAVSANLKKKHTITEINLNNYRLIPKYTIYAALSPICFIYIVFFFSQLNYYISAFQNIVPNEFSYAEYARRGFFELCIVSVINLIIIVFINMFCGRNNKRTIVLPIFTAFMSISSIVLIVTALRKMLLYIETYSLTPLRVYTSLFMIFLLIIFVLIILKGFINKIKLVLPIFISATVFMGVLCFSDIDGRIASYNIEQYKSGKVEVLDIDMLLSELSYSAIPYIVETYNNDASSLSSVDFSELTNYMENRSWVCWSLSSEKALAALKGINS